MQKKHRFFLFFLFFISGCKMKLPDAQQSENASAILGFIKANCLKVIAVTENGVTVFTLGGASNTKPSYTKFKLIFNLPYNGVQITENDGTVTTGVWVLNNNKISISGLSPALTDANTGINTRTTAEYIVNGYNADAKEIIFTNTYKNIKVGDVTVQYKLIPCAL
jgi:hypothetical protein